MTTRMMTRIALGLSLAMLLGAHPALVAAEKAKAKASGKKAAQRAPKQAREEKAEPAAPAVKPWSLRDHFTFKQDDGLLDYVTDTAEWRLRVKDASFQEMNANGWRPVLQSEGFSITLSDGRTVRRADLGAGHEVHDLADNGMLGAGYHYDVIFPAKDGLLVTHRFSTFQHWPFLLLTMIIENQGAVPISVMEAQPAIFGAGSIHDWSPGTELTQRHTRACQGRLMEDSTRPAAMAMLYDPARLAAFAVAIPVEHQGLGSVELAPVTGGWQGAVRFRFEPGLSVAPGAKVALDPVWISYGIGNPAKASRYWGWAQYALSRQGNPVEAIRAWAGAGPEEGLDALLKRASFVHSLGVRHALLPGHWEETPGSMRGRTPLFPKNIAQAAEALGKAGMMAGITFDPLCTQAKEAGAAVALDGDTAWINPALPEGQALVAKRVAALQAEGFEFFVLSPTAIPDAALSQFGLSRAAAQALAWAAAVKSAPKVFMASAVHSEPALERDAWLSAAAASVHGSIYGLVAAPVRLTLNAVPDMNSELCAAIQLYPGTLELHGDATSSQGQSLAWALGGGTIPAVALDAGTQSPKLWQERVDEAVGEGGAISLLGFAGAPQWPLARLLDPLGEGAIVGCLNGGTYAPVEGAAIPASTAQSLYGVHRPGKAPSFLAATHGAGVAPAPKCQWDAERKILQGAFSRDLPQDSVVYLHVPEGYTPKSATAGSANAKTNLNGRVLSVEITQRAARIEVKFD